MDTPDTLAARLAAVLVELTRHPKAADIIQAAAGDAVCEADGFDAQGDLVAHALDLARNLALSQAADCDELTAFWEGEQARAEAPNGNSDHTPDDCAEHSAYYAGHGAAHANTADDLHRLASRHAAAVKLAEDAA